MHKNLYARMTVAGVVVVVAAAAVVVVVEAVVVEISFHCCCFQRPQREQQAHQAVGRIPDGQFYENIFFFVTDANTH